MHYSKIQKFWLFIYWLFLVVSFCAIGFLLVTRATGYRYNPHQHKYQKTGMVIISNPPKNAAIELDGLKTNLKQQTRLPNVLPGTYRVKITSPNHQPWEDTVRVDPGFVVNIANVDLFLTEPTFLNAEETAHYASLVPYYNTPNDQLRIVDGELWYGTKLVSRYAVPPTKAILLPSNRSIIYLVGNDLRVINVDGHHDELLYTKSSAEAEPFVLIDDVIVLKDGEQVKALRIQ